MKKFLKNRIYCLIFCAFVLFSFVSFAYAINTITSGYRVDNGTEPTIAIYDATCRIVTNLSGNNLFVPTKTGAEWNAFISHLPTGTAIGSCCPAETNEEFCGRLGKNCGNVTGIDNCATTRTTNCGSCSGEFICSASNVCVVACSAETDGEFCSRLGKNCGSVTASDNCGTTRTANCGSCGVGYTCSASNVCVLVTGTWQVVGSACAPCDDGTYGCSMQCGSYPPPCNFTGTPCSPIGATTNCSFYSNCAWAIQEGCGTTVRTLQCL